MKPRKQLGKLKNRSRRTFQNQPERKYKRRSMEFRNPVILWGLIALPFLYYYLFKRDQELSISTPQLSWFPLKKTFRIRLRVALKFILILSIGLFLLALARPQRDYIDEKLLIEGIDIVLCLDISSSMKAEDFKPNRVGAAKNVAKEFITGRKTDRIGLVVFSRKAITHSPLTTDYTILLNLIDTIEIGMIQDGTAIGNAIIEGSKRLATGKGKSKVMILLTDGINNSGEIDPVTAAHAADALGIKIYTIGVGSSGRAQYPIEDPALGKRYISISVQIDEEMLKSIAGITGGRYFRATDTRKLEEIYKEINSLEKSRIEIKQYRRTKEQFTYPLLAGLLLFCMYLLFTRSILKTLP
jgi:Ca-activated chloride channel family protein